jgi:hypothetical protein
MNRKNIILSFFLSSVLGIIAIYPQNNESNGVASTTSAEKKNVALVEFKGSPDNIIRQFGQILQQALPGAGDYTSYIVDMNNLPPDVPPGGSPAYVCPSPSITNNAPYALTGEVTPDPDDPSNYHLRLYLWEMDNNRLIFSDEMTARDGAECQQNLPPLLLWIFSWLKEPEAPELQPQPQIVTEETPAPAETPDSEPEKWLYLGLRGGSSLRFYNREEADPFLESQALHFYNVNAAFSVAIHLFRYLDLQVEANYSTDEAPFTYTIEDSDDLNTAPFISQYMTFPLLVKSTYREGSFMAGAFGGLYYLLPLGQMKNDFLDGEFDYKADIPLGYTLGINFGIKAGPGNIFIDLRWAADIGKLVKENGDPLYQRSMVSLNIGYEFGLISKKKKGASVKTSEQAASPEQTAPDQTASEQTVSSE